MGACETTPPATYREHAHDPDRPTAQESFLALEDLPPLAGVQLVRPRRCATAGAPSSTPGRAARRPGQLRGRIQKNSQPSPAARVVTGSGSYALLTLVALMGAADRVILDCRGADIRVRRTCRTRPITPHGRADRGSRRRGERGALSGTPRCCRNSRTSPG